MKEHMNIYPVKAMCAALEVPKSGFYKWLRKMNEPSDKQWEDAVLKMDIRQIHEESKKTYGRPRLLMALQAKGRQCGKHRLVRLMKEEGIEGLQRRRFRVKTTDSNSSLCDRAKPAGRPSWALQAGRNMGGGYHLRSDRRGMVIPGGDPGHVQP